MRETRHQQHGHARAFASGQAPLAWSVMLVRIIELEFKWPVGRPFTMDHSMVRLYFAATEAAIGDYILPCTPRALMVESEVDIWEKFPKLSHGIYEGKPSTVDEVDFGHWAQSFSHDQTQRTAQLTAAIGYAPGLAEAFRMRARHIQRYHTRARWARSEPTYPGPGHVRAHPAT